MLNSPAADVLNAALRKEGYEPIAWVPGGFKQFNTTFPVRNADDFKGRVYRTMTSPILVKQYQSWGSTVTAMSFSEVYMGLQQRTIEGHEIQPMLPMGASCTRSPNTSRSRTTARSRPF